MRSALLSLLALVLWVDALGAQERVLVRRLSDVVGIREGNPPKERVLYYFDPMAELAQGDHVEQGSGGQSEITLSLGGLVKMHASAHLIIKRISEFGDVLEFPLLTTLEARSVDRMLTLALPGGTLCQLEGTEVFISVQPGTIQIRNQGGNPITVYGNVLLRRENENGSGHGQLQLLRGEEVHIPLFGGAGGGTGDSETELWGVTPVRHSGAALLQRDGDRLSVWLASAGEDTVTIGGVSTRPGSGRLRISNRWHRDPPPEPEVVVELSVDPEAGDASPVDELTEDEAAMGETGEADAGGDEPAGGEADDGETDDVDDTEDDE
jgi:hypothetical protein